MKPYQLKGLSFLVYLQKNGLSGILGDEMGLGKTLQTISLIQYLKEKRTEVERMGLARPSLVICPLSVLSSWMAETRRWAPGLNVLRFHGPARERTRMKSIALGELPTLSAHTKKRKRGAIGDDDEKSTGVDLILTTYQTFQAEQGWFKRAFVWKYAILDEGHKIKNEQSLVSSALQGLSAEYRLILTGTPLQNNMSELWALLHWFVTRIVRGEQLADLDRLYPEVFTDRTSDMFKNSFDLTRGKVNTKVMDDARHLLEIIMLRRMKVSPGVDLNLPPKKEILLFVPLTPMQRFWYTRFLTGADKGLLEDIFANSKEKEAETIRQEAEEKSWERNGIEELEKMESEGAGGEDWEESKRIMREALKNESKNDAKKSAWRKLMNLLMQLRKVGGLIPDSHARPLTFQVLQSSVHYQERCTGSILYRRTYHKRLRQVHRTGKNY